jgi:2,3-bisphosphoglycerate-dependent phosphoglycerate mutase
MSDLQCPATFLVVGWGAVPRESEDVDQVLSEGRGEPPEPAGLAGLAGLAELAQLAEELRDRRIAAVCSGRDASARAAATVLAGRLGVAHRSLDGLEPLPAVPACPGVAGAGAPGVGAPGVGVTGADPVSECHRAALDALADLHRGETVLVVTDASVLRALWPGSRSPEGRGAPSPYEVVTVQVDDDGWRLLGRPDGG